MFGREGNKLCRRNKRNTLNALRFEARQEENLLALREALVNHTYIPLVPSAFSRRVPSSGKSLRDDPRTMKDFSTNRKALPDHLCFQCDRRRIKKHTTPTTVLPVQRAFENSLTSKLTSS
jgi:hypothetical protein